MRKKYYLPGVLIILLIYPIISGYLVLQNLTLEGIELSRVEDSIVSYQLSIWISWMVFIVASIYHKWTTGKNSFFMGIYGFLVLACGFYGFFLQEMVVKYELASRFKDNYSFGVFTALQQFAVAAILTGFLQAAVWWFTRRWHRR